MSGRPCIKCGSQTRMMGQATISFPSELNHLLSKRNLRRKDVYLMGVNWETMDTICTNPECNYTTNAFGNYVSRIERALTESRAECERLRKDAINSCGMLIYAAGGEITVTDCMQMQNYEIARVPKMNGTTVWAAKAIDQATEEAKK